MRGEGLASVEEFIAAPLRQRDGSRRAPFFLLSPSPPPPHKPFPFSRASPGPFDRGIPSRFPSAPLFFPSLLADHVDRFFCLTAFMAQSVFFFIFLLNKAFSLRGTHPQRPPLLRLALEMNLPFSRKGERGRKPFFFPLFFPPFPPTLALYPLSFLSSSRDAGLRSHCALYELFSDPLSVCSSISAEAVLATTALS